MRSFFGISLWKIGHSTDHMLLLDEANERKKGRDEPCCRAKNACNLFLTRGGFCLYSSGHSFALNSQQYGVPIRSCLYEMFFIGFLPALWHRRKYVFCVYFLKLVISRIQRVLDVRPPIGRRFF